MADSVSYPTAFRAPTLYSKPMSIAIYCKFSRLRHTLRLCMILIWVSLCGVHSAAAGTTSPGNEKLARLKNGEVILETIDTGKPGGAARVTALFLADMEKIWGVIGYCEYGYIYIRGLEYCEMLQGDGRYMTMHHRLRHSWYAPMLDFVFEARRETNEYGDARLLSGNVKMLEAYWQLTPLEDGSGVVVVHEFRIQPKIPTPKWLIRHGLKNDLPDMLACIRGLARASTKPQQVDKDLDRCAGEVPSNL